MQDIFGTVRRSLVFRSSPDNEEQQSPPIGSGTLVDRINSCIRKSKVFSRPSSPSIHPVPKEKENVPAIRWRKGELIGCGAFGRVYMGMNLDSGELLAVKQVLIASNCSSKEKAQAHIKDLEEEVKLLKDLSHPNIVRYLGTIREEHSLNILLEFVPGGSISSLLGKFGAFPEAVIQAYTRQLLLGLEYLHKNVIIHRDIKGANILVDNKGCIKLADFGASKQVVELATISGAKSMKGTPYWMAPEVIIQTGHSFSADIWSVGCTVIEMATGKPPWSQQYQEVAALFHVGTTKSHPPIPEHLSAEAKDFLLKCLQEEPNLRPTASELLKHPFVTGENMEPQPVYCPPVMGCPEVHLPSFGRAGENLGTNINTESTCQIDVKVDSMSDEARLGMDFPESLKSFNPMCEPIDDGWGCEFVETSIVEQNKIQLGANQQVHVSTARTETHGEDKHFSFACGPSLFEDDDELTESKITAFLDEKALELKKLQTPLYEEFYNSLNDPCPSGLVENMHDENPSKYLKLPPKSRSPNQGSSGTPSTASDPLTTGIPIRNSACTSNVCNANDQSSHEISSPPVNDWKELLVDDQLKQSGPSAHFSNIQRKWKEELDQELERKREMMRQAAVGGKTSSSKDRAVGRQRDRTRFASPGK